MSQFVKVSDNWLYTQNVLCMKELRRKPVLKEEIQNSSLDMLNLRLSGDTETSRVTGKL